MTRSIAGLAVMFIFGITAAAAAQSESKPVPIQVKAQSLAENVLGTGLIRSIAVTEGGATLLMRWEAATYRPQNKMESTRDQLFGEAELVTGSVMGGIRSISRIRFTMARKDGQVLATGVNIRGPGVSLTYDQILGGGVQQSAPPKVNDKPQTGGTSAAKD
ncbi:MAG TPA: hypothetical protein VI007_10485 [bacterium]